MRRRSFHRLPCLAVVVAFFLAASQAQTISTIAGGGPNNLPASSSSIGYPWAVAVDSAGNTYISDNYSNRIFKVDTSTPPQLTVLAGNTVAGYTGDGGNALNATLNGPKGVAFDGAGNLYIADANNSAVRVVNTNSSGSTTVLGVKIAAGTIATVAGNGTTCFATKGSPKCGDGGPALGPTLTSPSGIFIDASGNLFIADTADNRVREVSTSGTITTVAGTNVACPSPTSPCGDGSLATLAELYSPSSVFVDANGNIFIVDSGDNRIREVVFSTGNIIATAGDGTACSSPTALCGDGGLAINAQLNLTQVSSVFSVTFFYGGISVDTSGNIFIADSSDNRIREVTGGNISTIAGTGNLCVQSAPPECGDGGTATSAQLGLPTDVFVDASGNILIADQNANAVREVVGTTIDPSGTVAGVIRDLTWSGDGQPAQDAELNQSGIATDQSGDLFIADTFNGAIRELSAGATSLSTVVGGQSICSVLPCGDGGPVSSGSLGYVSDVFVDSSNNIFFADFEPSEGPLPGGMAVIREITSGGTLMTVAGTYGALGYTGDNGLATSATMGGPATTSTSYLGSVRKGLGLFLDNNGIIYVADSLNNAVRVVNPSASSIKVAGVTIAAGDIATVAGDGTGTACASPTAACGDGGPATSAQLNTPLGLTVDSSGNIYIADSADNRVREVVGSTGVIQAFAGTGTACSSSSCGDFGPATAADLNFPVALQVDGSGNVFIADAKDAVVREVTSANGLIGTVAGDYKPGFSGDGGVATSAELGSPYGLAFDPTGNLLISDAAAWRVRKASGTPTTTTLTSSALSSIPGQSVTLTATVKSSGIPTGTVTFHDGSSVLGAVALSSGLATLSISTFTVGTHNITASYGGDLNFDASISNQIAQVVALGITTTALSSSANPSLAGQSVTFTAKVTSKSSGTPAGTVTFFDGATSLGSPVTLSSGSATLETLSLTTTTHTITAVYSGNSDFEGSTSNAVTQAVQDFKIAASALSPNSVAPGGSATATITLTSEEGFNTAATVTCSVSPTVSEGPTCQLSSSSVTPSSSGATSTLTLSTTGPSAMLLPATMKRQLSYAIGLFLPAMFLSTAGLTSKNRRRFLSCLLMLIVIGSCLFFAGCGSGSVSSPTKTGGTPAGQYTITITAKAGAASHNTTVTLTVN
jgi:Bacterial Ig-like domain (group 3)/NHL repeat